MKTKLLIFALLALAACKKSDDAQPTPVPTPTVKTYTVTYEVKSLDSLSASTYNVTYNNESNNQVTVHNINNGWQYTFTGKGGQYCYIMGQCTQLNQSVKVTITYNGILLNTAQAPASAIVPAWCSTNGTLPQ